MNVAGIPGIASTFRFLREICHFCCSMAQCVNTCQYNCNQSYSYLVFNYFQFVYDIFGVAWSPASRTTERHVMVNEALSITKMALAQVTVHPKVRQDARMLQAVCQTCNYIILHNFCLRYYIIYILYYDGPAVRIIKP